jgi:hypothetical protein
MKINLPDINWNDEMSEVFDKITVLTLKDAQELIRAQQESLNEGFIEGTLRDFELEDYNTNIKHLEALEVVIDYFGG